MTQRGHVLDDSWYLDYAAGTLGTEAQDVMMASHVELSDEARGRVAALEMLGGAMLDASDSVKLADFGTSIKVFASSGKKCGVGNEDGDGGSDGGEKDGNGQEQGQGADEVLADQRIRDQLRQWEEAGYGNLPVCMAKTQYSFSTDPSLRGAPTGHAVPVREVRLSAGAGFIVAICGEIMTMPGLPRTPAAESIMMNESGEIEGLF